MEVFVHDLRRTTRRGRVALLRGAYGLALLVALAGVYVSWFPGRLTPAGLFAPGPELPPRELARFAEHFVVTGLLVQLGAVLLLTPATVAGAVAEERQRGTLDLLLTTELSPLEILAGKFLARGLFLIGLLLTGLPVLTLTLLFGGVDPLLVAGGTTLTLATLIVLAGLGLFCSAVAETTAGALLATYTLAFPFAALAVPAVLALAATSGSDEPGGRFRNLVSVGAYAVVLAFFGALFLFGARVEVRKAAVRSGRGAAPPDASRRASPPAPAATRSFVPPPVDDDALHWKEQNFGDGSAASGLVRVVGFVVGVVTPMFTPALLTVVATDSIRFWVGVMSATLLAWCVIGSGLAAAVAVCSERERRTLDAILMLPGPRADILRAKWLACVRLCRWPAYELLTLWGLGTVLMAVPAIPTALLAFAAASHVAFAVSLGLWLSVRAGSTGRALLTVGWVLLAVCVLPLLAAGYWNGLASPELASAFPWVGPLLADGLSPPVVWWRVATAAWEPWGPSLTAIVFGTCIYALAAWRLWSRACARLQREG